MNTWNICRITIIFQWSHNCKWQDNWASLWFSWFAASGVYMYIETSSPRAPGDIARIDSVKAIAPATGACVRFWYHMYGADMGSLTMYTGDGKGGLGPARWSKQGDSGDLWQEAWIGISSEVDFQVRNWWFSGEVIPFVIHNCRSVYCNCMNNILQCDSICVSAEIIRVVFSNFFPTLFWLFFWKRFEPLQ